MTLSDIFQKAKTSVILVVCSSQRSELGWLPRMVDNWTGVQGVQRPLGACAGQLFQMLFSLSSISCVYYVSIYVSGVLFTERLASLFQMLHLLVC
jgi:hypothetical protein